MPRPTYFNYDPRYVQLSTTASRISFQETNDCAVIALAAISDAPYALAHRALAEHGRANGARTPMFVLMRAVGSFGLKLSEVSPLTLISQYPGRHRSLKNITTHHPDRFKDVWRQHGTMLLFTRGHVLAVKDGDNCDWTRSSARRVLRLFQVAS